MDSEIESILYVGREVSVYKIPPLKANVGHRAGEWGDLAQPLWKGRLRVIELSNSVFIQFEDSQTGELFAKADYDPERPSVEAVLDSSRYFVIRVEDSGRKAYIGMGFAERTDSFDFNVTLQDYTKRYKANLLNAEAAVSDVPSLHLPASPKKDYTLKEGQTFTIQLPGGKAEQNSFTAVRGDSLLQTGSTSNVPLLPPPPSGSKRR